jgi:hypothetical protein
MMWNLVASGCCMVCVVECDMFATMVVNAMNAVKNVNAKGEVSSPILPCHFYFSSLFLFLPLFLVSKPHTFFDSSHLCHFLTHSLILSPSLSFILILVYNLQVKCSVKSVNVLKAHGKSSKVSKRMIVLFICLLIISIGLRFFP